MIFTFSHFLQTLLTQAISIVTFRKFDVNTVKMCKIRFFTFSQFQLSQTFDPGYPDVKTPEICLMLGTYVS